MAVNKRLLQGAAAAPGGITPSEHFGVVLYEGDGSTSHSINGGKFGAAFYGNGSNSKITFDTNFPQQTSFTISFWLNSSQYNDDHTIFQFEGDSTSSNSNRIGLAASGTEFGFYPHNSSGGAGRTTISTSDSSALYNGSWHHVALVIDGTSNTDATMYIDGVSKTLTTYESYTTTMRMTGDMRIGGRKDDSAGEFMEGKLDQLRVFQKALTSSEVSTLYAETASTVESLDPLSEDTTDTLQVLGDSSCIATYRFENDETDLSGSYNGTGTEIQYAAGRYGQAASFNGSSSDVTISSLSSMFGSKTTFSVSLWFKTTATGNRALFDDYTAQNYNLQLYLFNGNLNATVRFGNNDGNMTTSSSTYNDGNWHHVVVTSNQTTYYTYVDGSQIRTWSAPPQTYSGGSPTPTIGAAAGGTANFFDGEIDQVRIFNKALSASEVTTLYNENSLVASYRFEGNANDDTRNNDGTASNVTYEYGLGFTPDLVWIKDRSAARDHNLTDSTRGVTHPIYIEQNGELTNSTFVTSFDTGGFTLGNNATANENGEDFVAWCWKANGGTTTSGTGTGGVSSVTHQLNSDAGFCITKFTSGSSAGGTVTHGLDSAPDLIFMKATSSTQAWWVWHNSFADGNQYLQLQSDAVQGSSSNVWNSTAPSASVVTLGAWNSQSFQYIMYAFKNVDGFSKIGTYTGNGSEQVVETGFEPAFVITKSTSATGHWRMYDNKRGSTDSSSSYVGNRKILYGDLNIAEGAGINEIRFLSNGFEVGPGNNTNTNGVSFIYMAFAADPDTEAPTVAKSFSTVAYTGDGTSNRQIDLGFKPGLFWQKTRDTSGCTYNNLFDIVRGGNKTLYSNVTSAEVTNQGCGYIQSFDNYGVTYTGDASGINNNNEDFVIWAWKADDNEPTIFGGAATSIYKFEDNANDVTGNNNGTASNVTYVTGKFNKAVQFNGSNSDIDLASRVDDLGGHCSFSVWINRGSSPTNAETFLKDNTNNDNKITFGSSNSGEGNRIFIRVMTSGGRRQVFVDPSTTIGDNNWHHIVITMNQTANEIKIYLDGELVKTDTSSPSISRGLSFDTIGKDDTYGVYSGKFDQIRIYRGVLEQIHVTELYNETASQNDDLTLGGPPETIISANANAGFSIIKYEGTGVTGTRISHGLSAAPELWIGKQLSGSAINWQVLYSGFSEGDYLTLNTTAAKANSPNVTFDPTATTVKFHANQALNDSGEEYIGYAFHSVSGYSKIGSYTGNGSSQSITTGFAPDWLMFKRTDQAGWNWEIHDTVRGIGVDLAANSDGAEQDQSPANRITINTNGFTHTTANYHNISGASYIYVAFKIN